jgi:hypothetical protein
MTVVLLITAFVPSLKDGSEICGLRGLIGDKAGSNDTTVFSFIDEME